jgi:hypothetical protein
MPRGGQHGAHTCSAGDQLSSIRMAIRISPEGERDPDWNQQDDYEIEDAGIRVQ